MKKVWSNLLNVVIAVTSAAVAYYLTGKGFSHFKGPAELKNWQPRSVAGVTVDSPGEFQAAPLDFGEAKKLIDKSDNFKNENRGFEIEVLRTTYVPNVQLNIDGAVNGMVSSVGALEGVSNLQHTSSAINVSGKPGLRVSMKGDRTLDGKSGQIFVEALLLLDGRTLYQIETDYDSSNPHGAEYSDRALKSVKLN